MAQIAPPPVTQPVELPRMSPQQAGRPGETIAGMGDEIGGLTELEGHIQAAQGHVDTVAAANQIDAAATQLQIQLEKTQNSRDVPAVLQQGRDSLNEIAKDWSKSPAALQIQMHADSLNPWMQEQGVKRTTTLQTDEFEINLAQVGTKLAGNYANARAAGDDAGENQALDAFIETVKGGVSTGLVGAEKAADIVRKFREQGQELQIRNAISNPDPKINQAIYDQINSNPGAFPDVTPEQLDTLKEHALSAVDSHIKIQDWASGQMALNKDLRPKINQFTNPATGQFDEGAAMTDNAKRLADGEINETQSRVLAEAFNSHGTQLHQGLKTEAGKRLDDIETDLSKHQFQTAAGKLEANRAWFEQNGFSEDYRAAMHYTQQAEREVRAQVTADRTEARYEHLQAREEADQQSKDQFAEVQHFITGGGVLTKADLQNMAGTGKGKMKTADVDEAWKTMQAYEKEPDFAAGLDYLSSSFAPAKGVTDADVLGALNKRYADSVQLFQQQVNANPTKSKLEIAHDIVKSTSEDTIKEHANQMFGVSSGFGDWWKKGVGSLMSTDWLGTKGSKPADAPVGLPANAPQDSTQFTVGAKPPGMVQEGNLPVWNRPTVQNADGSHSSEYSTSFNEDGKEVLVPTVVDGKFLTPDGKKPPEGSAAEKTMFKAAWQHYKDTGENLGKFSSVDAADAYADKLHNRGDAAPRRPASVPANYVWNPQGNGGKGSWQPPKQ